MQNKAEINYLYFSFFFLFLFALTFSHFFHESQPLWGAPLFFLLYAMGQALLEVLCLILIGYLIRRWMPNWTFRFYIALSFVFLLMHFANFTLVRIMDVSLSYCFKVFFGSGLEHFRLVCQSTNVNSTMAIIILSIFLLVPLVGIVFYWATTKLSNRNPLVVSQWSLVGGIVLLSLTLLFLDIIAKPYLTEDLYRKYRKTLPLGLTFLTPDPHLVPLPAPLQSPRKEQEVHNLIANRSFPCQNRPNIYLFVIETLRRDCIEKKIAPNMDAFGKEHFDLPNSFSNANFTYLSWFSIFHSSYPFFWTEVRDRWSQGSIPLHILKKLGYRIRVYSSSDLHYFGMDRILFGKERQLIDSIQDFFPLSIEPHERDQRAIQSLIEDFSKEREGTLFITFLDSTHSEYSSPETLRPFQPAAAFLDYLTIARSEHDLELLKNRYRNSVHWVDHLFGQFVGALKERSLYEDALIVLTGDHGEEFFEEGSLFHGTHLNEWQTHVPLFFKFPDASFVKELPKISTHLDLFPSILHYLTGESEWGDYFDGQSLAAAHRWPFAFTMQHNGVDIPYEFRLTNGIIQFVGRFLNPPHIYRIPGIELLSVGDTQNDPICLEEHQVHELVRTAFNPLLSKKS